jgi:hypothetical protein
LAVMEDAIEHLTTAIDKLNKLGEAYEDRVGKLLSTVSDAVITLAGMWSQCTSRMVANYRQGKCHQPTIIMTLLWFSRQFCSEVWCDRHLAVRVANVQ